MLNHYQCTAALFWNLKMKNNISFFRYEIFERSLFPCTVFGMQTELVNKEEEHEKHVQTEVCIYVGNNNAT